MTDAELKLLIAQHELQQAFGREALKSDLSMASRPAIENFTGTKNYIFDKDRNNYIEEGSKTPESEQQHFDKCNEIIEKHYNQGIIEMIETFKCFSKK